MPVISVIVPVYKVEKYLDRCVKSILAQTFEDFELILVDDGSPDNCGAMCDAWAAKDDRITVIHQQNGGLSAARNAGIDWVFANSASQWLTFIDSDDWVHPEMLERLLAAAIENRVEISICGYGETAAESPTVLPQTLEPVLWKPGDFYQKHYVNATIACAKLYHRSCFASVRYPVGKIHEDEFVTYRLLFEQQDLAVIAAPLYAYYINLAGITKKAWSPKRLDAWEAYEQQILFFEKMGDAQLLQFRYREYLENAYTQLRAAQEAPNAPQLKKDIRFMKKRLRTLIRRAWKQGYIVFWVDYDMLCACAPIRTKLYRFYLEHQN